MAKLGVINTGGTISCVGRPLKPMTAKEFARACETLLIPIFEQQFPALSVTFATDVIFPESSSGTLDSTNLQPTDWCIVAKYILDHYELYDGWVVLHGTDSMDFTGTALPFLLSAFNKNGFASALLSKPVIITGSQVPLFSQLDAHSTLTLNFNSDAYQNFCGSIASAQSGVPEVCVYFNNNLFRANRIVKTNSNKFCAFSSPNYPLLGEYGIDFSLYSANVLPPPVNLGSSLDDPKVRRNVIEQLDYVSSHINSFPVAQFNAFPAWYDEKNGTAFIAKLLDGFIAAGTRAIVLESYGEGNFPSGCPDNPSTGAVYNALMKAKVESIIVVDCTQVTQGTVNDSAYAAGSWLPAVGALNPADMTPMAALSKLMVLLSMAGYHRNGWTIEDVKYLVQVNLLGEMQSANLINSRTNNELLPGQKICAIDGSATLYNDAVLGPVLKTSETVLWKAFDVAPDAAAMPGRLTINTDGTLSFCGRSNQQLWSIQSGMSENMAAVLRITGSTASSTLALEIFSYITDRPVKVLYRI